MKSVDVPIDEVTLMEDRARVVRRAKIDLAAGAHRMHIEKVSPVLVDKTLRAVAKGARVRDARVTRKPLVLAAERDREVRHLEQDIDAANEAIARLANAIARIDRALELLDAAGDSAIGELGEDASWQRLDADLWRARLQAHAERERSLKIERLDRVRDQEEKSRDLARAKARKAALLSPGTEVLAAIEIDVDVDAAANVEIEISYVVASACWRPMHRAELENERRIRFESGAAVWQNTGEDWNDVRLRFSTERPSLGMEPPRLATDRLRVQKKSDVLEVEARKEIVEDTGLGRTKTVDELPGIDDGGEELELRAAHRARVPSDGRMHRTPLGEFEAECETTLFCAPELVSAVLVKSVQTHAGSQPILAGPVDLVREGGFVGRTSSLYVARGERFELGWGPDPALRVHREVEKLDTETNLLRNWHSTTSRVTLKVSNLASDPKRIELIERVPVSEIEKVKIEVDKDETSRGAMPDEDGFIRYDVELGAYAREKIEVRYVVRKHSDVVGL